MNSSIVFVDVVGLAFGIILRKCQLILYLHMVREFNMLIYVRVRQKSVVI